MRGSQPAAESRAGEDASSNDEAGAVNAAANEDTRPLWRRFVARVLNPLTDLPQIEKTRWYYICLIAAGVLALAFTVFFCVYLFGRQDAYQTNAEDLGIMDQALWNTLHGAILHQTICNPISDTNCIGDVSRFAIHFKPFMLPLSLVYLVAPSPKTLFLIQTVVVATGAFPAFWIASRRLASPLAGVAFAFIYLSYPALTAAVTFDFHAVTLSAAFLMFALYFLLTRNNPWLFIMCFLAITTKEEVMADIFMIGLGALILQRRTRVGLGLIGMTAVWAVLYLIVSHAASPLGHSPLASRYAYLGSGPVEIAKYVVTHPISLLREHIFDSGGVFYLRSLLSGAGYLSLLAPVVLIGATPVLLLNLLSTNATMRSGVFQYNAEIVPFFVLAAIEGVALVLSVANWLALSPTGASVSARLAPTVANARATVMRGVERVRAAVPRVAFGRARGVDGRSTRRASTTTVLSRVVLVVLTLLALGFSVHEQRNHGNLPFSKLLVWPEQTAHTRIADSLLTLIPANASVSAQETLVPHVSERRFIYQFPYDDTSADYVFLDVTGDRYPYAGSTFAYAQEVQRVLADPDYHVVAAEDGYLLIARGAGPKLDPSDLWGLPQSFYSFTKLPAGQQVAHPLTVGFGDSVQLVGYDVTPSFRPGIGSFFNVETYWQATGPVPTGTYLSLKENLPHQAPYVFTHLISTTWLPMDEWQPGTTYVATMDNVQAVGSINDVLSFELSVLDASNQPLTVTQGAGTPVTVNADGSIFLTSVRLD